MTEEGVEIAASVFPGVKARTLLPFIDGVVDEVARGVIATRVVKGWRIVTKRGSDGTWLITAKPTGWNRSQVPPEVAVVIGCVASDGGLTMSHLSKRMIFDAATCEVRLTWREKLK